MTELPYCVACNHDTDHKYPVLLRKHGVDYVFEACEIPNCGCTAAAKEIAEYELSTTNVAGEIHLYQRDIRELEEMLEKEKAARKLTHDNLVQLREDFKNLDKEWEESSKRATWALQGHCETLTQKIEGLEHDVRELRKYGINQLNRANSLQSRLAVANDGLAYANAVMARIDPPPTQYAYDAVCRALEARHVEIAAREEEATKKDLTITMLECSVGTLCETLTRLWQLMYPGMTDWEYPGQVTAHMQGFLEQKDDEIKEANDKVKRALNEIKEVNDKFKQALNSVGMGGSWW